MRVGVSAFVFAALALIALVPISETAAQSICVTLADALPKPGTVLPAQPMLKSFENLSHGILKLPQQTIDGYSLQSSYVGSLNCQRSKLFQATTGAPLEIQMPQDYAGGEAELCDGDFVKLVEIAGRSALLKSEIRQDRVNYRIVVRGNNAWSPECGLTVETDDKLQILAKNCDGPDCEEIAAIGLKLANALNAAGSERAEMASGQFDLSDDDSDNWDDMLDAAEAKGLDWADAPVHDPNGIPNSFYHGERFFVPIRTRSRLLLGNIGSSGFGSGIHRYGPLLAVYAMSPDGRLGPVGGFMFETGGVAIRSVSLEPTAK